MGSERRLVNRELQTLPIGTRVRLTNGRTATLVALTFTSATVKIDPGQPPDRRANGRGEVEIAPAAEVDLVEDVRADADPSTDDPGLSTDGHENAARPRAEAAAPGVTMGDIAESPTGERYDSRQRGERALAEQCRGCGGPIPAGRTWGRYCSGPCRQRAYRRRVAQHAPG